jgi:hypothetical protein
MSLGNVTTILAFHKEKKTKLTPAGFLFVSVLRDERRNKGHALLRFTYE